MGRGVGHCLRRGRRLFGSFLYRGAAAFAPVRWRSFIRRHLLVVAFVMGILLALLGTFYQGKTYGTGYHEAAAALKGAYEAPFGLAAAKWAATVFSYWAGIPGGIFTPSLTIGAMIGEHMASSRNWATHPMSRFCSAWPHSLPPRPNRR